MEYESRKVKWYWLIAFILYSGGVVYLLFQANPFLYSHHELKASLTEKDTRQLRSIPARPNVEPGGTIVNTSGNMNSENNGMDPLSAPRSKSLLEYESHPVNFDFTKWTPQHISADGDSFYLVGKSPWIVAINFSGEPKWQFKFLADPGDRSLSRPIIDTHYIYVVHPKGDIVALNKKTGSVVWLLPTGRELIADPFAWENQLVLPVRGDTGVQLLFVNRLSGQATEKLVNLEIKPGFSLSYSPQSKVFIASIDNKILAIDPLSWKITWTQSFTEPIRGPVSLADSQIFISTIDGKIIKADLSKRAKIDWETDLENPAMTSVTYVPHIHRIVGLDSKGNLFALDAKTGKSNWRSFTGNKSSLQEVWAARLKAKHIEEFSMDWLHKGWVIWAPCSERNICIFTPIKGQNVIRISLSGAPMTEPILSDNSMTFFLKGSKPSTYVISRVLDESEIKRLKKEASN